MFPAWDRYRHLVTVLMLAAVIFSVFWYVASNWSALSKYEWSIGWTWIAMATLAMAGFSLAILANWKQVIAWDGTALSWSDSLWIWSRSSLTRYVPGLIWAAASRIYLSRQIGVSWQGAVFGYGSELLGTIAACFAIGFMSLPIWIGGPSYVYVFAVIITTLGLLPLLYLRSLAWLLPKLTIDVKCDYRDLLNLSIKYSMAIVVFGLGNYFVLKSIVDSAPPIFLVIGITALARGIGSLNVFTPAGIGTRELILVIGLNGYLEAPELITWGVFSRLTVLINDIAFFLIALFVVRSRSRGR